MIVTPIKTNLIKEGDNLLKVISKNIKELPERSILVVTAKIVSICQGRLIKKEKNKKFRKSNLIKKEADYYLNSERSRYRIIYTIKNNILGINAGINKCNIDKGYILLPKDVQNTTNIIWKFLKNHYSVKKIGVIITDSTILPLRRGSIGVAVSYCGFKALYNYQNKKDIFGRKLSLPQMNIADVLAASAVLEMGEAGEKQPFCIIEKVGKIEFQNRVPNQKELKSFLVDIKDDLFAPILEKANWKKGKGESML